MDPAGRIALHYAALKDDADAVLGRVAEGDDTSAPDAQGFTPLHLAAQSYAVSAARALIAAGADVNATNQWGNGPLWVAVFSSQGRGEMIELLREAGADPQAENTSGKTPYGLAQLIGNYDVAQYFDDLQV